MRRITQKERDRNEQKTASRPAIDHAPFVVALLFDSVTVSTSKNCLWYMEKDREAIEQ